MGYTIKQGLAAGLTLNEGDTARSVIQNVALILSTRRGSVPMYREFGLPMEFLDKPLPVARAMAVAEIADAISEFEPRAVLVGVTFEVDAGNPGRALPVVEVEIDAGT
jgi:phage baseplate assembly protein W